MHPTHFLWQAAGRPALPGLHVYALACRLGTSSTGILNALVGLERCGRLLYEDDRGRLYPFHDAAVQLGHGCGATPFHDN